MEEDYDFEDYDLLDDGFPIDWDDIGSSMYMRSEEIARLALVEILQEDEDEEEFLQLALASMDVVDPTEKDEYDSAEEEYVNHMLELGINPYNMTDVYEGISCLPPRKLTWRERLANYARERAYLWSTGGKTREFLDQSIRKRVEDRERRERLERRRKQKRERYDEDSTDEE